MFFLEIIFVILLYVIYVMWQRMNPTTSFNSEKNSVDRQVVNDTVRCFHHLNINVILYGNANWNSEANSEACSGLCICIYMHPNAFNNLL